MVRSDCTVHNRSFAFCSQCHNATCIVNCIDFLTRRQVHCNAEDCEVDADKSQAAPTISSVLDAIAESLQSSQAAGQLQHVAVMLIWRLAASAQARNAMLQADILAALWKLICKVLPGSLAAPACGQGQPRAQQDGAGTNADHAQADTQRAQADQSAQEQAQPAPDHAIAKHSESDILLAALNALAVFAVDAAARHRLLKLASGSKAPILQQLWQVAQLPDVSPDYAQHASDDKDPEQNCDAAMGNLSRCASSQTAGVSHDDDKLGETNTEPAMIDARSGPANVAAQHDQAADASTCSSAMNDAASQIESPGEIPRSVQHDVGEGSPAQSVPAETTRQAARRLACATVTTLLLRDANARQACLASGAAPALGQLLASPSLLVRHHAVAALAAFATSEDAMTTHALLAFGEAADAAKLASQLCQLMGQLLDGIAAGASVCVEAGQNETELRTVLHACAQALQYATACAAARADLQQGRDLLLALIHLTRKCSREDIIMPCQVRLQVCNL